MSVDTDLMIIERPILPPGRCAVSLSDTDPQGFIDTGLTLTDFDPRVIVSVSWVKTTAKKLGLVEPEGDASNDELFRENARLRDENAQLNRELEAIDVIESRGFTARKKAGRPRKRTDEEN